MHVQHIFKPAVMLLAAGAITLLAPAANAEAPQSPQDAYGSCIQEQIERSPLHPNLDVIQGYCCAQAGGTPSYSPKGAFLTCALPAATGGSGHQPPKPGSVAIRPQLPGMSHV